MTLTAIGLAVHIQSLPDGARVDIKTLAARFPEGETRIASALRELETHGYVSRTRERLPSGRVVTHTVAYDRPGHVSGHVSEHVTSQGPDLVRQRPVPHERPAHPVPDPPQPVLTPVLARVVAPECAPPPEPAAVELLADLGRHDARLLLSERELRQLAPAVAAWLERGASAEALRRRLTARLPDVPRSPAALLAYRLASLPPQVPAAQPALRPPPLQNCDGCDRAFRSPEPGRCAGCRTGGAERAA